MGQEIEVRPGLVSKDSEGKLTCKPIRSKIVSLFAEQNDLMYAVPGGLIGVGTKVSNLLNILSLDSDFFLLILLIENILICPSLIANMFIPYRLTQRCAEQIVW